MSTVFNALAPVFLLILIGYAIKRKNWIDDAFWAPAERITYYVFFPALLVSSAARVDFENTQAWPLAAALFCATFATAALALALKPFLNLTPSQFTSFFQGTVRPNTYVGVVAAFLFWGDEGLVLISIALLAVVPLVNVMSVTVLVVWGDGHEGARTPLRAVKEVARNPLILACLVGFSLSVMDIALPSAVDSLFSILGRAALPVALMAVGAGLDFPDLMKNKGTAGLSSALKLLVLPALAWTIGGAFGLEGQTFQLMILYATMPVSASAYVLARELGGDAPMVAGIITASTLAAMISMPLWIVLSG